MTSLARRERRALCDLLEQVGPDAPTLCEGWDTRDLAAHLFVRERRLDAAAGILVRRLAGHNESVRRQTARQPWPRLIDQVRNPPIWSPVTWGPIDTLINAAEFFVHHEDVRRAQPRWEPRTLNEDSAEHLWRILRVSAGRLYRRSPVGVVLTRPDGVRWEARPGTPAVTVHGEVGELLMHAYGRTDHARVQVHGDQAAVAAFNSVRRRV